MYEFGNKPSTCCIKYIQLNFLSEVGATDCLHFFTDRNFSCGRYPEFDSVRLYSLVGAELAEKGQIILIAADIFSEYERILFYSPFERQLPCGLYLPDFNTLISAGCNVHIAERLSARYFDIGRALNGKSSPVEEIAGYTMNQSNAYMNRSLELMGAAELLLKEYMKNGRELLKADKLRSFAARKVASMISERKKGGTELYRSVSAVTCSGYRFAEFPEDYRIICLEDCIGAASSAFVKSASKAACRLGCNTIISRAVDSESAPLHLIIRELKTAFISDSELLPAKMKFSEKISLNRFYSRGLLVSREHDTDFFREYIRKMYSEAALYARICMDIKNQGRKILMPFVNEKTASEIASEIVHCILNR